MTRPSLLSSLAVGVALALRFPAASPAQGAQPTVQELRRVVERREQEFHDAEVALALARARLARAEGKAELAAAECRTLLRHYEARLKAVQDLLARGRLCFEEPLREAQGSVAIARAWLAEAEGRRDDLLAELPKVIACHEWRIQNYQSLARHKAIPEEVTREAVKESETELRWARERLVGLRGERR
jgi:hypothetical protein